MDILQEQFDEQRKIAEEFCFLNRMKRNYLDDALSQSERKQRLIKDWNTEIITQFLHSKKSVYSFSNFKSALTAFCKYAGYENTLRILSQLKYVNTVQYYPSFSVMRDEIRENINEINPLDIRQYDNIVIVAYLIAMGLTPKEISELKKTDYQNGIIRVGGKVYSCPDDFVGLLTVYSSTDSYMIQCATKQKTIKYRDTDSFLKSTATAEMSLKTVYLYTKKIPIICAGRGTYEIQQSKIMWDLFLEHGYDLENPNVLRDTDWESVKKNVNARIPVVDAEIEALVRNSFLDTLIRYRNNIV